MGGKLSQRTKSVLFLTVLSMSVCFSLQAFDGAVNPAAQSTNVAGASENAVSEKGYVIGATNLIFIKVLGQEGLQQTYRVDEDGYITHPLLGRVKLMGKTVAQTEELLKKSLDGDYILDPNVTVFVLEHSRFSILGEVRKPGNYEILGQISLVEALSFAGGFTPLANLKKVNILRHDETGKKTITVNVKDVMEGKNEGVNIQAGDVIEVPTSFF